MLAQLLVVALTISAPQAVQRPSPRPFQNLFEPGVTPQPQTQGASLPRSFTLRLTARPLRPSRPLRPDLPAAQAPPALAVVCGMTIVSANPAIDPKITKVPPADTKFTMRTIQPPVCR